MIFPWATDLRKKCEEVIKEIDQGERLPPKHNPPVAIGGYMLTEADGTVFQEFRTFGHVFNRYVDGSSWTIHELPDTDIGDSTGPLFGRNYRITYNALAVGKLKIGAAGMARVRADQQVRARATLEVEYAQFISFGHMRSLPQALVDLVIDDANDSLAYSKENGRLDTAMLGHLWNAVADADVVQKFWFETEGAFAFFKDLREAEAYKLPESDR